MNLKQQVIAQLEKLAVNGPKSVDAVAQEKGYIIGIAANNQGVAASLSLLDYDRYSAALQSLEVINKNLSIEQEQAQHYLQQVAAQISQQLTYLEEPLALLELSAIDNVAQLRSSPPAHTAEKSIYWEVSVQVNPYPRARLTRYQWVANRHERVVVTYPATFATLGRLAEDLATSLSAVAETNG